MDSLRSLPFLPFLVSHAVTVLGVIASFVMVTGLIGSRRTSQSVLAWLLALVFVPFVAIPLYFVFGSRKFPARAKGPSQGPGASGQALAARAPTASIARVLQGTGVSPPRAGNSFEVLPTGEAAYARLLELIRGSARSIDLTMFILGRDETGDAIVGALAERARSGVSVRVILDAVGSSGSKRHAASVLAAAGGEVRAFMPLTHSPIRGRTNLRSHRKVAVFDDLHAFAGGMNLADEYMGSAARAAGDPRWRDVAAVTRGPVVADAAAMFASDWAFCGGGPRALQGPPPSAPAAPAGDAIVQFVPSGPDLATDTVYDLFLTGIFAAKERIALVTPYYVPDDLLQRALVLAARRGVRTEVVVPTISNHAVADVARRSLLRELAAAGVAIRYYPHGMVHAKAMVIDDSFAYVGSPNFDMRSLFLNYEDALCVYSPGAIAPVRAFLDGLIAQCNADGPRVREHRILELLARFVAPEL